jgi:hypothetical protein
LSGEIESFALFTNFIFQEKGWKILFANRWQWVIKSDKPLVRMHVQTLKTPWLFWLGLRTEENYGKGKWNWVLFGPDFSFPLKILEHFRFYPNWDFARKILDLRTYFSYSFSF